jgi:4-amino-4-deoxy-L-arabinose transferase-like glycosyltransferase
MIGPVLSLAVASATDVPLSRRPSIRWFDPALLLIVLLGLYFRFQYIHLPMAEAHRWREIFNADVARNFHERSMNILYPQVNWGGAANPHIGMEFPLMHWIVAALYGVFGEQAIVGRLVSMVFSVGTIWAVFALGTWLFGVAVGRAAAFLLAISPSAVFFGRFFISDTPMVFFSVIAVLAWAIYLDTRSTAACVAGSVSTALALLVKIPAVLILAPIAWLAWESRRWSALKDRGLIAGGAMAVAAAALWYWHADVIFHQSGLGVAIWHPAGTYGPPISHAAGPFVTISSWSTMAQLGDPGFYDEMLTRIWALHLTAGGFILALFSLAATWRRPRRRVLDIWLGVVLLFILVSAEGNRNHEFYQLPMLPPAALLFGLAAAPAFDGRWLREHGGRFIGPTGSAAVLLAVAMLSFRFSGVVPSFFRPQMLDIATIQKSQAIGSVVEPDALIVTVEYEQFGNNSPILLYWAHRRGWSFDLAAITPHVIELLRKDYGAKYFASTVWSAVSKTHPDVEAYLRTHAQVALPGSPRDTVLFDLSLPTD